jgi:outer membrane protein assembly factor BamB
MSRRVYVLVAVAMLLATGSWIALRWWSESVQTEFSDLPAVPAGRWNVLTPSQVVSEAEDEMARVMSLPYVSGRREAEGRSGVVFHDPAQAMGGVNFYVSGHAPEALVLDMDGAVLHRWRLPFEDAFDEEKGGVNTAYWRRALPLPDGSVVAIFQAGGMVKVDRDSNLLWAVDEGFYNDLEVTDDGTILAIGKAARVVPEINLEERVLEDFIVAVSAEGVVLGRFSLLRAFLDSPFSKMLTPMKDRGDIFHTNTLEWLDGSRVERSELFRRGNLLVSLREVDVVAIVDPLREIVEWASRGPWDAQHQPTLLADGNLLIFDNRGAGGRARVLEFDLTNGTVAWEYTGSEGNRLMSPEAGSCQRLPGGTTLITESERGRAIEVTRDGEVVWEFVSPHRAGPQRNLVATLFEVVRIPRAAVGFLDG